MRKIIILSTIVFALLPWGQANAQNAPSPEIGVHAGFGLSTLSYDLKNGSRDGKMGGNFGVTGTYFLSNNFGLTSGLEVAMYGSKANFNALTSVYRTATSELDAVDYRASMKTYAEKQNIMTLNIPIMAQVQTSVSPLGQIYLQGGLKVAIPISGKFTSSGAEYTTSYFFHEHNVEVGGESGEPGLGTFQGAKTKNDLPTKVSFALAAEAGFKWNVASNRYLYTGVFVDYGLSSIVKTKEMGKSVVEFYQNFAEPNFGANSALSSHSLMGGDVVPVTKKVVPFAVGVKLRFAFACGK